MRALSTLGLSVVLQPEPPSTVSSQACLAVPRQLVSRGTPLIPTLHKDGVSATFSSLAAPIHGHVSLKENRAAVVYRLTSSSSACGPQLLAACAMGVLCAVISEPVLCAAAFVLHGEPSNPSDSSQTALAARQSMPLQSLRSLSDSLGDLSAVLPACLPAAANREWLGVVSSLEDVVDRDLPLITPRRADREVLGPRCVRCQAHCTTCGASALSWRVTNELLTTCLGGWLSAWSRFQIRAAGSAGHNAAGPGAAHSRGTCLAQAATPQP